MSSGYSCSACSVRWSPQKTPGTALTSAASVLFEAPAITSEALEWDELPALRVDTSDPQYAWLSNISVDDPEERLEELRRGARGHC